MTYDPKDVEILIREKYAGVEHTHGVAEDIERLKRGEPLAYVIGNIPFLGLSIGLSSRPLIPRPETEWWAEALSRHIGERPVRLLDLCAGSGAIGLAILAHCKNAHVSFGEIVPEHSLLIRKNIEKNNLDASRADVRSGDLFEPFSGEKFNIVATNPPYIPETRPLPDSVRHYEPAGALYAGADGLFLIRRIFEAARDYLTKGGELWIECDIANIEEAALLARHFGAIGIEMHTDQYKRPRLLVSYW